MKPTIKVFFPAMVSLATVFAGITHAMAASSAVKFSPHRAVYDISLASTAAGSGVAGLTGRMVYELTGSTCDGYTQTMRFVSRMTNQDGAETINDLRTSSLEQLVGKSLKFSSTQYQNETIAEASQGIAVRDKGKATATVDLVKPTKKKVPLPSDVYFPMQHAALLIESARTGRQLATANLFDGSEKGDKYYLTTAAIGKKFQRGPVKSNAAFPDEARLAEFDSWPVSISYFEPGKDKQDSIPAYELAVRYYENGITGDLKIDYGEFAIKGDLSELTFLEPGKCKDDTVH